MLNMEDFYRDPNVTEILLQNFAQAGDATGAVSTAKECLDKQENVTLDIAVTGETGAGKSHFVNAIRGLDNDSDNSAPTGITETTSEPKMYVHPTMPNVRFWDLPGIGSPKYKAKTYLKDVKFDRYDFFIIISSQRIKENDIMLAQEIKKRNKQFYFVRSKIDIDIGNEKERPNFNEVAILSMIREDCMKNLKQFENPKVFLISSADLSIYDFQTLVNKLEKDLPEHKRNALIQSLPVCSLEMLEKKKKMFKRLVWASATASAAVAVVPVPGLSVGFDAGIMLSFFLKCFHSFGLNDESLKKLSSKTNVPEQRLKGAMKSLFVEGVSMKVITRMFASFTIGASMALEYCLSNIPIVGSLAAGGLSFGTTYYLLNRGLEDMSYDAERVLRTAGLQ